MYFPIDEGMGEEWLQIDLKFGNICINWLLLKSFTVE